MLYFSRITATNNKNNNSFDLPQKFTSTKWLVFYRQQQGHNTTANLSTTSKTCLQPTTAQPIRRLFLSPLLHQHCTSHQATVTTAITTTILLMDHLQPGNFTIQWMFLHLQLIIITIAPFINTTIITRLKSGQIHRLEVINYDSKIDNVLFSKDGRYQN